MKLRVKEICKEKGVTIGYLAEKMQMQRESLSRAINGNPTVETLEKIAIALDVPISTLFVDCVEKPLVCPGCGIKLKLIKDE
jgi:transcriptional regulator with XRE-family HTH domain